MTTPVGSRRRQRSTRVIVAAILLVLAAVAVIGTAVTGSWLALLVAAGAAVVLGAAATKITHTELLDSRRDAARERAEQAQAYRELTEARTAENVEFAADMNGRLAKREATITRLERRLSDAAGELADARRELAEVEERAESAERESTRLGEHLADAEERAGHAVGRVAELEHEVDLLTSELQALKASAAVAAKSSRKTA